MSEALIRTVEQWGRERGMTHIQGPLGFTDMDAEGMLIEGFDQLGTMATIYNYPYYPAHMERLGFRKDADWVEFKIYIPDAIPDKHRRISELVQRKYGLKIKKYTSGKKIAHDYGQAIFELINEAFAPLYGYSALSQRQIDQYVKMYLPILDLRMVTLVTDADDRLIAVGISMPSLSRALQKAHGRLLPFGWFHLLKALYFKRRSHILDLLRLPATGLRIRRKQRRTGTERQGTGTVGLLQDRAAQTPPGIHQRDRLSGASGCVFLNV